MHLLTFLIFLTLLATGAAGEVRLTLESAPAYALRHNPALAAARLRIEEARGRSQGAGRLANPELELEFSRQVRASEGAVGIGLTQRFPLTARLRLEKAISRAELAAAEAEVRDVERRLAAEVRTAAVKLLALRGQQSLRERQLANSRELASFTTRRLETGEASQMEGLQVQLESQQIATELLLLEVDRAAVCGELRPLLGLSSSETPVIIGELPAMAPLPSREVLPEGRADLAAARHTAAAAGLGIDLARANRWGDFGAGLSYTDERAEDAPEGFEHDRFISLRFSLPLPLWDRNEGGLRSARATAARSQKELEALGLRIGAEAAAARETMAALARLVRTMDTELLPKAQQIEEQLQTAYTSGQSPLAEVLRARSRRLQLERERLDALRDFHLATVRHRAAIGTPATSSGPSK